MTAIRCGDHVRHEPTGEKWVVAYVDGDRLAWCGWPDGDALLSDCTLIKACTDEEHRKLLVEISKADAGRRSLMARREIEALVQS